MINGILSNEPIQYLDENNEIKRLHNFRLYKVTKDEEIFFVIAHNVDEILESRLFRSDDKLEIIKENMPLLSFKSFCLNTLA